MTLLVGDAVGTSYTSSLYTNFGGAAANRGAFQAVTTGTAVTIQTRIIDWGSTTSVKVAVYGGTSAATATSLVGAAVFTSAQGTGILTANVESSFTITAGNYYRPAFNFSPSGGGDIIQLGKDNSFTLVSGEGISTALTNNFASPINPLTGLDIETQDGRIFFNIDGTAATTQNSGVKIRLEVAGSPGTALSNRPIRTTVTDLSLNTLYGPFNIQTSSGLLQIDSQSLGDVGDDVIVHMQDLYEQDNFAAIRSLYTYVLDLDAGALAARVPRTTLSASGTVT